MACGQMLEAFGLALVVSSFVEINPAFWRLKKS
jgi:hypothetical protein